MPPPVESTPPCNLDKHLLGDTGQRNGARESAVCSVDTGGRCARNNLRHHFVRAATATTARARCRGLPRKTVTGAVRGNATVPTNAAVSLSIVSNVDVLAIADQIAVVYFEGVPNLDIPSD